MADLRQGEAAAANPEIVAAAMDAMWTGDIYVAVISNPRKEIRGRVWEIYRSIKTRSLRIRMTDSQGLVHHHNSLDFISLRPVDGNG
jgi:hypothetical protein